MRKDNPRPGTFPTGIGNHRFIEYQDAEFDDPEEDYEKQGCDNDKFH
jgi:hypothetical protein